MKTEMGDWLIRTNELVDGFAWNGKTYPSLSKIALAITGTRWNGPQFFGLRDKGSRELFQPLSTGLRNRTPLLTSVMTSRRTYARPSHSHCRVRS